MGRLTLPESGLVYVDTQAIIYTVERHPRYAPALRPLWEAASAGSLTAVTSELTLMETLVVPFRTGDEQLAADYERALSLTDMRLLPVTQSVLREAARLRARYTSLRSPDALHVATSLLAGCSLFVTNDRGLKQVSDLHSAILDELLSS